MDRQNITVGFKIRSIGKVSCEAAIKSLGVEGWSVRMIFCIVAGLTLPVLSMMVGVGFKCYLANLASYMASATPNTPTITPPHPPS